MLTVLIIGIGGVAGGTLGWGSFCYLLLEEFLGAGNVYPFHKLHTRRYSDQTSLKHHSCTVETHANLFYTCTHSKYNQALTEKLPFFFYERDQRVCWGSTCNCTSFDQYLKYHFMQQNTLANFLKSAPVRI